MITDATLVLSNSQIVRAAGLTVADNNIDLTASRDIGCGQPIYAKVTVAEAFGGGTGTGLRIDISNSSTVTGAVTVQLGSMIFVTNPSATEPSANDVARLVAGATFWIALATAPSSIVTGVLVQPAAHRYILAGYTCTGTFATGKLSVELTTDTGLIPRLYPMTGNLT